MRVENSFEVGAPPEQAWDLLMDVPRVIPCLPGAELTETVDESAWKATMAVKLGPVSLSFATDVTREEADAAARRAKLSARAREQRGRGAGQATIESTVTEVDGGSRVDIVTDLSLSGAVAQYGRGIIPEVASQLVGRFADCLERELAPVPAEAAGEAGGEPAAAGTEEPPAPAKTKPVSGLSLGARAVAAVVLRPFRRLYRKVRGRSSS
jgi:uncharacterized protein